MRLAEDVEDMQVAYGVDGIITGVVDNALTVIPPVAPALNVDPNVSTAADGDEWVPNVTGEDAPVDTDFQAAAALSSPATRAPLSPGTARASTA